MNKRSASKVYLTMSFISGLANSIMFTTYAVYYVSALGLNPFELVLVGTFLELTVLLLEIPTGVVADSCSRRLSVIIGMFILGAAYMLEGSIPWFKETMTAHAIPLIIGVIAAEMIRGVGEAFLSGAGGAWITDEAGEDHIGKIFMRENQVRQIASVIGIVTSVMLAAIKLNLPYFIGGVLYVLLAFYLAIAMPERRFQPAPRGDRNRSQVMLSTFKQGLNVVRGKPVLLMMLGVTLFAGAASEAFDRLWEAHFLNNLPFPQWGSISTVVWFGVISICSMIVGIAANEWAGKKINLSSHLSITRALFILMGLKIALTVSFGLAFNFVWGFTSLMTLGVIGSIQHPIYNTWLNQNLQSQSRATVLSMMSQSNAFGQTAGGPIIGWVGTRYTIRASMILSAVLLLPTLAVFRNAMKERAGAKVVETKAGIDNGQA